MLFRRLEKERPGCLGLGPLFAVLLIRSAHSADLQVQAQSGIQHPSDIIVPIDTTAISEYFQLQGVAPSNSGGSASATANIESSTQQCFNPVFTLMGLNNFTAPWPEQCTYDPAKLDLDPPNPNDDPCWCIPDGGHDGCCPDPGLRPVSYEWQVADAFKTFKQVNSPIEVTPACDPFQDIYDPSFAAKLATTEKCKFHPDHPTGKNSDADQISDSSPVCAFLYADEGDPDTCGPMDRIYELHTYPNYKAAEKAGAVVTHYGACGFCSNANDLGVMIDPRTVYDGTRGQCAVFFATLDIENIWNDVTTKIQDTNLFTCYKDMGFTDSCSFVHAAADIANTFTEVLVACDGVNACTRALSSGTAPNKPYTCGLNDCLSCEREGKMELNYMAYAGRDLQNSGLVMYNQFYHIKFPCSYFFKQNKILRQDPYAKANKAKGNPPNVKSYKGPGVERFDPSVSLQLLDNCMYSLKFSFKHDPTLPHAGGWDGVNAIPREEWEKHCSKEDIVIAPDGLPYRDRRMFTYYFNDDVKKITGIFDHMNIDFNPCGHHDEIYFGRTHYDIHMYTVPDWWRDMMQCDITACDYQDCIYDQTFQTTPLGKAFMNMGVCRDPFPDYVLNDPSFIPPPIQPGSFNRNMPLGFLSLSHTGNPRSGVHSLNVLTALGWNDTQVNRWTEPVLFMMSFDDVVTVYEPMVPVEFAQGKSDRTFLSPETPPLCQTNMGLPLTYVAEYDAKTGYTSFTYSGQSPSCMCDPKRPFQTPEACAAHQHEMDLYDSIYTKWTGKKPPAEPTPSLKNDYVGKFHVTEIEDAFGLTRGVLKIPNSKSRGKDYGQLIKNNFWTDWVGKPGVLNRFIINVPTARNTFMYGIESLGRPYFQHDKEMYTEHVVLGCFYKPKDNSLVPRVCTDIIPAAPGEEAGVAEFELYWNVVGYVDEYTRILFVGNDIGSVQFMTEFVMVSIVKNFQLLNDESYAYSVKGPNAGEFTGYKSPETTQDEDFYGNAGDFIVTQEKVDLDAPCPYKYCGILYADKHVVVENPLGAGGAPIPWPQKIANNKCSLHPCEIISGCKLPDTTTCPDRFVPGQYPGSNSKSAKKAKMN